MKKKFITTLVTAMLLVTGLTTLNVEATTQDGNLTQEKQLSPEISQELDKKMDEYNETYSDQLIDMDKVNLLLENSESLSEEERAEAEIELLNLEESFQESDINTFDFGPGNPTGTNNISFNNFSNGDIILVHDGFCSYGYWRHAGIYDASAGNFITATAHTGMTRQTKAKMRGYDEALGVCPENYRSGSTSAINVAKKLLEKKIPYAITAASKNNNNYMYCSLVAWRSWKDAHNVDLDFDGGPTVIPTDLSHEYSALGKKIVRRFVWSD